MESNQAIDLGKWSPVDETTAWKPKPGSKPTDIPIGLEPGKIKIAELERSISAQISADRLADVQSLPNHRLLNGLTRSGRMLGRMSLAMILADLAALAISCGIGGLVVHAFFKVTSVEMSIVSLSLFVPILLGNLLSGLYPGVALNPVVEFRQLSRSAAVAFLCIFSLVCLGRFGAPWIVFLIIAGPLQFMLAPLSRALIRSTCSHRKWWGHPVIIFGAGEAAKTVVLNLLRHPAYGLRPALVIDPRAEIESLEGLIVINRPRLTHALAKRLKISHAIVVLPDLSRETVTRIVERHARGLRHVMLTSAISPFSPGLPILWRDTRDLAGVAGVEVRNRLLDPTPRFIKRSTDLLLTITGGICILPLIGLLALLVKISSKGPIFYSHTRIGLRGQRFAAWKFRSMIVHGQEVLDKYLQANPEAREEWERDHKLKNDPRVTPLGAFMRKTSLDELPQLWNVLIGEMSLVGPRPIVDAEIPKYGKYYNIYKAVRPGITGLWQVSGRNDTSYEERLRHDEFYVRNWSPWLDMHLLARTVSTLIGGHGAY